MYLRIFILCLVFFSTAYSTYGQETLSDTAWSLGRVLKLDHIIRTDTGSTLDEKKKRSALLYRSQENIKNIFDTWNTVPTTDRSLEYILTLQKYRLSCEIAAMTTVLEHIGYPHTEDEIIATLPHHNKPYDKKTGIW